MKAPTSSPRERAIEEGDYTRERKRHFWQRTVFRRATSHRRRNDGCSRAGSEMPAAPSALVDVPVAATAAVARKECADCGRWSTPMWRPGPGGPKTLCNACGIKYRRRKKKETSPFPNEEEVLVTVPISRSSSCCANEGHRIECISSSLEMLSTDELKSRQREKQQRMLMVIWEKQKQRRKRERGRQQIAAAAMAAGKDVAEAALLLLSLSSSSAMLVHS